MTTGMLVSHTVRLDMSHRAFVIEQTSSKIYPVLLLVHHNSEWLDIQVLAYPVRGRPDGP